MQTRPALTPWLAGVPSHYARPDIEAVIANQPEQLERRIRERRRMSREVYFLFPVRQGLVEGDPGIEHVRARYPRVHVVNSRGVPLFEIYRLEPADPMR